MIGAVCGGPVAVHLGLYTLRLHLVVCAVASVLLAHCGEKVLRGETAGVARHHLGAGAAGGAGIGAYLCVVHYEAYLLRPYAGLSQRLVGGYQRAHIRALSVILPAGVYAYRAVGVELGLRGGGVNAVQTAAVYAERNAYAVLIPPVRPGVLLRYPLFARLIQRARLFKERLLAVYIWREACGYGGALGLLIAVHSPHLKGVYAHLCGEAVYGYFRAHEGLRRAVGAEGGAPCVVCEYRATPVAYGAYAVARAGELAQAHGEQVSKLGIRAVVYEIIAPEGQQLALLVRRQLNVHEGGGALSGVGYVLIHVEHQGYGPFAYQRSGAEYGLVGGRELIPEGASRMVLYHTQLFHWYTYAARYHWHVKMYAYGLGVYGEHPVLVYVGIAAVRLKVQVRLAGAVALYLHLLRIGYAVPVEIPALYAVRLKEHVRGAGVYLYGVGGHGVYCVHVGRQLLYIDLNSLRRRPCLLLRLRRDYGYGVAELEYLIPAKHRPVKAVVLVVLGKHDEAVYLVGTAGLQYVLVSYDLEYAGHLFRLGGVYALYVGVGYLSLGQGEPQRALGQLQRVVRAEIPASRDLLCGGGAYVPCALYAVSLRLEYQVLLGKLAAHYLCRIHHRVYHGLIAGAAAQVPVFIEPVPYLLARRAAISVEQRDAAHYKSGRTEAALGTAVCHPRDLKRVHVVQRAYSFYRSYFRVVLKPRHLSHAGTGHLSVHYDVAGSAVPLSAADFAARQQQSFTEQLCEGLAPVQHEVPRHPIDNKFFPYHSTSLLSWSFNLPSAAVIAPVFRIMSHHL